MKSIFASKTIWVNLVVGLAALVFPPAKEWIDSHPTETLTLLAAANLVLRLVTRDKVVLFPD